MLCANVLAVVVGQAGFPATMVARRWRDAGTRVADVADAYQSVARYRLALAAGFVPGGSAIDMAARHGSLVIVKWLRANGCDWNSRTCAYAAFGGHLEVLQWARASGCEWNSYTCE